MTTVYAPPDVEAAFATYLNASTSVPNPRVLPFRKVTRAGGQQTALILSTTRLIVECWAETEPDAYESARQAWGLCWSLNGGSTPVAGIWVARMELTDPINFPDPETSGARYQFIAQPTVALTPVEIS